MTDLASALAQSPGGLPQAVALDEPAQRMLPDSAIIRANLAQAHYHAGISLLKQGRRGPVRFRSSKRRSKSAAITPKRTTIWGSFGGRAYQPRYCASQQRVGSARLIRSGKRRTVCNPMRIYRRRSSD